MLSLLFLLMLDAPKVTPEAAQALSRKLAVVSAQMRLQRARADFAEAQAVMKAAQAVAEKENAALEGLLKTTPGYKPGCYFDEAELACPPEAKK